MRHNKGFSLVELIVVIAIMAVLAAVAVIGVSIYIPKAKIASDQQLIGDIMYAGELSFNENFIMPDGAAGTVYGYVVITESGISTNDPKIQQALQNAFGADWRNYSLKSEEWKAADALATLNSVASMDVEDSSFVKYAGMDTLMSDVQHCASSLSAFLAGNDYSGFLGAEALDKFIGEGTYVKDYLSGYKDKDITEDVLGNAVVFGLAEQLKNDTDKANEVQTNISSGYYILRNWKDNPGTVDGIAPYNPDLALNVLGDENDKDLLTETAATYAALEAFSSYIGYKMQTKFTGDNTLAILAELANDCNDAVNYAFSTPELTDKALLYLTGGQAAKDAAAYLDVMNTVSDVKGDYKNDLSNTDLFGNDQMINRVNGYVAFSTMGEAVADIEILLGNNEYGVVVIFTVSQNGRFNSTVFQAAADPRH